MDLGIGFESLGSIGRTPSKGLEHFRHSKKEIYLLVTFYYRQVVNNNITEF